MEKEFLKEVRHSVTLNVTAGKIDSYRELDRTCGTVRVYDKGCIGIAGCLGEPDEAALTAQAREALAFGIPYPCDLDGPLELETVQEAEILPISALVPTIQRFLDRLGALCPRFAFSNKISLERTRREYRSTAGRRLVSEGRRLSIGLVAQNRGSGNLFDTLLGWSGKHFDEEAVLAQFRKEYDAFYRPAELAPGRYPIVTQAEDLIAGFVPQFLGDLYAAGASLLSGKLGQRAFSELLSFRIDKNPATAYGLPFFDAEGRTAPDFRPTLIENGVLKGLLTTKKTAAQYGLPALGAASAAYDGVPDLGFGEGNLWLDPTANSLKELVPGKAVYVVAAAGGDMTPDGHFATPVQMAYLLEDGEPVGRLPELNIGGSFFDLLGKDYRGAVRSASQDGAVLTAVTMDVDLA